MLRRELYLWPFAKKLYYGWISTMTSSNENCPPPEMKSWLRPWCWWMWCSLCFSLTTPVVNISLPVLFCFLHFLLLNCRKGAGPQPEGGNRAIASPRIFQKRMYLLGTATSLHQFAPPRKDQLVAALKRSIQIVMNHCSIKKAKLVGAAAFQAEDISQNLVETNLSPWLWEFDCYSFNWC